MSVRPRALAALILCSIAPRTSAGAAPSPSPVLRIEAGAHSAAIRRASADAEGRWLATASDDKTARVWDLRTGALLKVLRPPLADGRDGELSAIAMSPDGQLVVTGGNTGLAWAGSYVLYAFERATGRLVRRVEGLPFPPASLGFSADGRWLAVAVPGEWGGVRIFRTDTFAAVGEDASPGGARDVGFAGDGRLAATGADGFLRVYQVTPAGLLLLARGGAAGSLRPRAVTFSPDARLLAVALDGAARVDLYDARTLDGPFELPTHGLGRGSVTAVAWSAQAGTVFAAGTASRDFATPIRAWRDAGRGGFADLPGATDAILDLRALPGGRVAFVASDPSWGVLDASGKRALHVGSPLADFPAGQRYPEVSADGSSVRFAYDRRGRSTARFDVRAGTLAPAAEGAGPPPRRASAPGVTVDGYSVRLGPRELPLDGERPRAVAVAPGDDRLVVATSASLRAFDRAGRSRWTQPAPPAVAANVSGDGRLAVAAFRDGTIRWYRMSDGTELLALFPHADAKRWVAWTPGGYYAASPGGEDLVGWHVNRGPDQAADFFPASVFREALYRPDVVARVLETLDEAAALRAADADAGRRPTPAASISERLPPVVEILSPGDAATFAGDALEVPVKVRVRAPAGAPARALLVRVNGRRVHVAEEADLLARGEDGFELSVRVLCEDTEIQVLAENPNAWSAPATVRVACEAAR